jgi:hypothetical protein
MNQESRPARRLPDSQPVPSIAREAVIIALEALEVGDQRQAVAILLAALEDGPTLVRAFCPYCNRGFEWPGLRDAHLIARCQASEQLRRAA